MKHVVASLTIGACLLLPAPGMVLAANLHTSSPSSVTGTGKGQTGSNHGNSCTPGQGPSAGAVSAGGSAFNPTGTAGGQYAGNGANTSTPANAAAVAQYDVACFQAP
jgi:hypothetical protein